MGKMLLVMDEAHFKNCRHCRLRPVDQNFCCALRESINEYYMEDITDRRRPDCPLKPMPEKNMWDITKNGHVTEYAEGYNACIDEILGEEY